MKRGAIASPTGLAACALAAVALFIVAHALGLRDHANVLSGAPLGAGTGLGLGYVVLYFAAVVGAPVLAIAAVILTALTRLLRPERARR